MRSPLLSSFTFAEAVRLPAAPWTPTAIYWTTSFVLFAPLTAFYLLAPFGFDSVDRDTWHHVAVIRELMANPWTPSNPHIPTEEASRYYSPPNLVAALIGRAAGASPFSVFTASGAVSCVMLCVGARLFARAYYGTAWSPLAVLLSLLFAWGVQIWHAGFHSYAMFASSAAYPSSQSLVIGLFCWAWVLRLLRDARASAASLVGLVLLTTVMVLTHQLTAATILAGAGSFALFWGSASPLRRALVIGALGAGTLLSLIWPYFNPLTVVLSSSDPLWVTSVAGLLQLEPLLLLALPVFLGVAALRHDGRYRFELILPIAVFWIAFAVLFAIENPIAHRVVAGGVLYLQLAFVWLVLTKASLIATPKTRPLVAALLAFFLVLNVAAAYRPLAEGLTVRRDEGPILADVARMAAFVPEDAVAFATENAVYPYQASGRRVVSIPRPEPAAPSLRTRQTVTDAFFDDAATAAERRAMLAAWDATHIVFAADDVSEETRRALYAMGPSARYGHGIVIIAAEAER